MTRRPCITCGTPTTGPRCPAHRRTNDREARGYGTAHIDARKSLAATLPAPCGYGCGTQLTPDGPWVAAHIIDGDPNAGWIASCRPCNEQAKAR